MAARLAQIGEVDQVSILPLVERLIADGPSGVGGRLRGEPGVAYLIRAGATTVLFDVGLNPRGRERSALADNAETLQVELGAVEAVVISHLHADHSRAGDGHARGWAGLLPRRSSARFPEPVGFDTAPVHMTSRRQLTARIRQPNVKERRIAVLVVSSAVQGCIGWSRTGRSA